MTSQLRLIPALLAAASLWLGASGSFAATIHYGDFGPDVPTGVTMYQNVRESSGTDAVPPPLFDAPTLSGDTLSFTPPNFSASGGNGELDVTDGQLNLDMMLLEIGGEVAGGLESILISESGDFSLTGAGTALTSITAGVSVSVQILEVDGAPITPISMAASSAITRDLVSDGPVENGDWSNSLLVEFGPSLAANNVPFTHGVTKAKLVMDDQLIAISEAESVASVAKRHFSVEPGIDPNPDFEIPEPASAALLAALAACAPAFRRRVA